MKGRRTIILNESVLFVEHLMFRRKTEQIVFQSLVLRLAGYLPFNLSDASLQEVMLLQVSGIIFRNLLKNNEGWQRQTRAASQYGHLNNTAQDNKVGIL